VSRHQEEDGDAGGCQLSGGQAHQKEGKSCWLGWRGWEYARSSGERAHQM